MISKECRAIQLLKKRLDRCIEEVSKNIGCYCNDPGISFTRRRKLPPDTLINLLLSMEAGSASTELKHFFKCKDTPSTSALYQQRMKMDHTAFERVFNLFLSACNCSVTHKNYRLLAADGTDTCTPYDKDNKETFILNGRGHNEVHVNAIYDILNDLFIHITINSMRKAGEADALLKAIEEFRFPEKSIVICDRGYESYEVIAGFIENNRKFVLRCKDIDSNGILSPMKYPDSELDLEMPVILTRKQTNITKEDPKLYRRIMTSQRFKYLPITEDYYPMKLRVVRFKITDNTYESLITNLSEEEFSAEELKDLYHLRWSEEVSFRQLKYPLGMIYLHSKNLNLIKQEMFAKIIMYNFVSAVRNILYVVKKTAKYTYKFSFKDCVTSVRMYFKGQARLKDVIADIKRSLIPIRPGRSCNRNMTPKSAKTLSYRIA